MLTPLPIDEILPRLTDALRHSGCAVLCASPGAGKTTRVPPALQEAGFSPNGKIVMLEPRRIAARSAARRMAFERDEPVGRSIGYRVRFDERVSRETQILVVTEGILLRQLLDDPFLEGVDVVIFDEFHERRLDSDLALAMVRRIQQTVHPDLRILVMSATLDPGKISAWLGNCPTIESAGRMFPVRIEYLRREERLHVSELAARGTESILQKTDGDVLVFLPGVGEILRTRDELEPLARRRNLLLMPLFGDLPPEEQDRVLLPCDQRKVVLSTNVAETSVTIDGITAVVDSGLARQMQLDADAGLDRLELMAISRASADQRAGRAGRTQPGICLRLWEERANRIRPDFETAELHRVDLSSAVLRLIVWGETDVCAFPWFEAPPETSIQHAKKLLHLLGGIDDAGIATEIGHLLVRFPVSPRLARLLVEAHRLGVAERGVLMAAMLSERDPFLRARTDARANNARRIPTRSSASSRSDVLDRLAAVEEFLRSGESQSSFGEINRGAVRNLTQVAKQLMSTMTAQLGRATLSSPDSDEALLRSLVAGFPDRVARRRDANGDKGLMVGGRGVRQAPTSAVQKSPLFLCVDVDGRGSDALVRLASEVQRDWLPENLVRTADELFFHPTRQQVVARRRVYFDDLVLDEIPATISDPEAAAELLFDAAKRQPGGGIPQSDDAFQSFVTRMRCLKQWMPELPLPDCDEVFLTDVLRAACRGLRSLSELKSAAWLQLLQARLDYSLLQLIEREAPERITVPSGSRIRLTYEEGRKPILAVRIQEVFGLKQSPRVAGGRIPVLLHLLAPNMRPQQVTDDLASFWASTYSDVRKELKRRYPKHAWPEDPLNAEAVKKN